MSYETDLAGIKEQQEQAKALWTKLQGIAEYLEGKIQQEVSEKKVTEDKKRVVKKK